MLCVGLTVGRIGKFLVVIQSAMRIPDQFSLPRHCRIEQFRKFNSISHTVTSRFSHKSAKGLMPTREGALDVGGGCALGMLSSYIGLVISPYNAVDNEIQSKKL